jgi:predicted transcriptional regulator
MNHKASASAPSKRSVISVHTKPEVSERLEILSAATRRSKSFLANEAIEQYLSTEASFIASVEAGIADANAGRMYTTEELKKRLYSFIEEQSHKTA